METLENQKDYAKTWRVLGAISGSPDSCSPNEAIRVGDKILTSNPSKTDGFAAHYAKVSKISFSAEERSRIRLAKRTVNSPSADDSTTSDFPIVDLNRALKKMKNRGAAGPDEVPPTFLKNLGNHAKTEVLRVFNMSFREGVVPQVWRNAVIIPLLKSAKPASSIASYRPVSLTSCIVKLLERMIFHRLYNLAESRGMFCHTQAGFRKNRSCKDQLIRISQNISDGFQERKPKRTVMALLDLSRAYDRVCKEDLLLCLFESGVPLSFIRWIWAFLRNRQFRVLFNSSLSRTRWLVHGVPQGAVFSPMLFLFYINSVADVIPKDVLNSIFADDLTIWASDHNKETAQWRVQKAVKHIESWCRSKKMLLSDKSVVTFFSTASCDSKWVPSLNMNNLPMKFDPARSSSAFT